MYRVSGETSAGIVALSGVEALTVVGLGVQIVLYARPFRPSTPSTPFPSSG